VYTETNKPIETVDGKLSLRLRQVWTYSEETRALEEEVKLRQEKEKANGLATPTTVYDVYFK
jgi:hypothetical protein